MISANPNSLLAFQAAGVNRTTIVNRLTMSPDHSGSVAVVVEGSTDVELYKPFLLRVPRPVVVHTKSRVDAIWVVEESNRRQIPAVAIIDSDDEVVLGCKNYPPYVVRTDYRDAEATLFLGPPGDELLRTHFDIDKVEEFENRYGLTLKEAIIRAAAVAGAARVVNAANGLGMSFKDTEVTPYLDREAISLNSASYLRALAASSRRFVDERRLSGQVERVLREQSHTKLVPGHDLIRVVAAASAGSMGSGPPQKVAEIEKSLRTACTEDFFRSTSLHHALRQLSARLPHPLVA